MRIDDVEASLEIASGIGPPPDFCDFTARAHAFLTALARRAGWPRSIVLRSVAGLITQVRRKKGCVP